MNPQATPSDRLANYFPELTDQQLQQFRILESLYPEWNGKINVISRQDIANLFERHILHSLAIARIVAFPEGSKVLDAGTGGGFPGIPLAILFPGVRFRLVDSTAKKLRVAQEIATAAGIGNVETVHSRLEDHHDPSDFVVSRAVTTLDEMVRLTGKNLRHNSIGDPKKGIFYLKGGSLENEIAGLGAWNRLNPATGKRETGPVRYRIHPISAFFQEEFFSTKSVVHLF
jgi:16S rRNA (guanine527-N7)-methyltransferase